MSSPDFHSSYPDYPPPSFEEVLALDRRAVIPNATTQPPTREEVQPEIIASPQPPPATNTPIHSPGTPRAVTASTTPWEEDRRLGLSLEERVRRELERNLKPGTGEPSPKLTIETVSALPLGDAPPPSSGTPTSVAASNFLTPQNSTPSPLGVPLPLSTRTSPKVDTSAPRSPSPLAVPPKSPALSSPPASNVNQLTKTEGLATPKLTSVAEPQAEATLDRPAQTSSTRASAHEQTISPQPTTQTIARASPCKATSPLAPLLFTTRLNIDGPPEPESPVLVERTPDHGRIKDNRPMRSNSKGKLKEVVTESPASTSAAPERAATPQSGPPRKVLSKPRPLSELPSAVYGTSLLFQPPLPRRPLPEPPLQNSPISQVVEKAPSTPPLPKPAADSPVVSPSSAALRRPPPPPPPRPRPRSVGAGVAARISAYETILANAPKIPPPIPPRPRERQQASSSTLKPESVQEPKENVETKVEETRSPRQEAEGAHIPTTPAPRSASPFKPEPGPSRIRSASKSRPLFMPPAPSIRSPSQERTRRDPSPERPKSPCKEAHALVPARIGPDGKFEIIPDAEVIWLDETKATSKNTDEDLDTSNTHRVRSNSRAVDEQRHIASTVPVEAIAGPSTQRIPLPISPPAANIPSPVPSTLLVEGDTDPFSPPTNPTPLTSPTGPAADQLIATPRSVTSPHLADDFEYTDLDLLISRLEENEAARQGANYEQLLTVGEVLGPAAPPRRAELDLNVGLIEIQRRRVMKDGRVKLKLSLMGVFCLTNNPSTDDKDT
ncbi:hypothetical protein FRC09_004426 [Ceratobasidium sp. 395]|nr:hypothetical protein FRC09_004426 [Ceratobasidium sp. 395]